MLALNRQLATRLLPSAALETGSHETNNNNSNEFPRLPAHTRTLTGRQEKKKKKKKKESTYSIALFEPVYFFPGVFLAPR